MHYSERKERLAHVKAAETEGRVADSMDVRLALMAKVHSGGSTLEQVQAELNKIKREAGKAGKITRDQAYRLR